MNESQRTNAEIVESKQILSLLRDIIRELKILNSAIAVIIDDEIVEVENGTDTMI